MPIDFSKVRAANPLHEVASAYVPDLKKRGNEWVGLCPFHDDRDPSFTIYQGDDHERYHCFACGAGSSGGDVIDFVREVRNCDTKEAIQWLENGHVPSISEHVKKPKPKDETGRLKPIVPVPDDAPEYDPAKTYNPKRGKFVHYRPERVDAYRDENGRLLYYVVRLNLGKNEDGKNKKITPVVSYCETDEGPCWAARRPAAPYKLMNLDKLTDAPTRSVLVVSGEKCVAAAEELNFKNGFIPVTWLGGDNAVEHTDWTPLRGRRVVFFPDADEPGRTAMADIAEKVPQMKQVRHVETEGLPKGGDIADIIETGVTGKDLIEWFKKRVKDGPVPLPESVRRKREGNKKTDKGPPPRVTDKGKKPPPRKDNVVAMKKPEEDTGEGVSAIEYTDSDNIARFRAKYAGKLLFVPEWRTALTWDDERLEWEDERSQPLMGICTRFLSDLANEAVVRTDMGKQAETNAKRLSSYGAARALTEMVRQDRFFRAGSGTFNIDPYDLGVPGGVVNLKTGQLRPRRPEDRITKQTSVEPEKGEPTRWLDFLHTVMRGDDEMVRYLQILGGYCLTGDTTESKWFFLYGGGRNGKSTYLNVIGRIVADYYRNGQTETFMQSHGDRHPADLAALQGARMVTAMEVPDNRFWNVVRIKQMTGGDPVTARVMRGDDFSYIPQYKLLFTGNELPRLRGVDEALRRRLHLIPFTYTITEAEKDGDLPRYLIEEEGGRILNWLIEGARLWFKKGLPSPEKIREATEEYMDDNDIIGQFIEEELEEAKGAETDTKEMYQAFRRFTENANEWQGRQKWLTQQLKQKGLRMRRTTIKGRTVRLFVDVRPVPY